MLQTLLIEKNTNDCCLLWHLCFLNYLFCKSVRPSATYQYKCHNIHSYPHIIINFKMCYYNVLPYPLHYLYQVFIHLCLKENKQINHTHTRTHICLHLPVATCDISTETNYTMLECSSVPAIMLMFYKGGNIRPYLCIVYYRQCVETRRQIVLQASSFVQQRQCQKIM